MIPKSISFAKPVKKVTFCKNCVNSNLRPRLLFNDEGICDACTYSFRKYKEINWKKREKELVSLLNKFRSKTGKFDVIVPSSGGKDSSYVAHQLKYKYGMNPLCVCWAPSMYTDIGWENMETFCKKFDTIIFIPNREIHSKLTRVAFEYFGDVLQPWQYGMEGYPQRVAEEYNIPLIMYGENQWEEYGGAQGKKFSGENTLERRKKNQSMRVKKGVDTLVEIGVEKKILDKKYLKKKDFFEHYRLTKQRKVKNKPIKSYFYSYFKKWVPHDHFYYAVENCGFKVDSERTEGTFTKYASLDDKIDELYFYFQFLKFGFGRSTTEACREIRDGYITREEGVNLVKLYDGEFPARYLDDCLEYMNMDKNKFFKIEEKFRNKNLFKKIKGSWKLKNQVT